jgi:membrane fusion protein (multidrug efflux system)
MAFTGRVTFVSGVARRENNAFRIEASVANAGRRLKGGMIARAEIARGTVEAAVAVPLAAVVPRKGDHVVFVLRGERAERRVVRIESITGHEAILSSGLAVGETIVIEGHRALQDGMLLEVTRTQAAQVSPAAAGAGDDRI